MAKDLNDLEKLFKDAANFIPSKALSIIEVETLDFVKDNFKNEGVDTGSGIDKWKERKTEDRKGRDITRYRTSRRGRKGALNKYGRTNQGRSLLVGHKTGGNKLRNSYRAIRRKTSIAFRTYKPYAERHNEGKDGMPQRMHIGKSRALDRRYTRKLNTELDKFFKR